MKNGFENVVCKMAAILPECGMFQTRSTEIDCANIEAIDELWTNIRH